MRNKFTALALIIIAIISANGEGSAEEEQTAEIMDENIAVTSEISDVPEAYETDVKPEPITEAMKVENTPSDPDAEVTGTEPDDEHVI